MILLDDDSRIFNKSKAKYCIALKYYESNKATTAEGVDWYTFC
jgi:hypothetical protein